jgi:coenzyme F420-dependent glucose-6-phosphate dehydrogenase
MTLIGYQASHEQFAPSEPRISVVLAQKGGHSRRYSSDHFHPWSKRQGQSGIA